MNFNSVYNQILNTFPTKYRTQIKSRIMFTWNRIYPLIKPGDYIAEIGAGPMLILAKQIKETKVMGLDLTDSQSSLYKKFNIDLRLCDIQNSPLPIKDSSLNIIFLLEVIEHLCMYPHDLFDKIFQKLKPGGYLILTTPNLLRFSNRFRTIFGKSPLINYFEKTPEGSNHIREFVPDEMVYYLKKSGFRILKKELFGITDGNLSLKIFFRLIYLYPNLRNYFLIVGQKIIDNKKTNENLGYPKS